MQFIYWMKSSGVALFPLTSGIPFTSGPLKSHAPLYCVLGTQFWTGGFFWVEFCFINLSFWVNVQKTLFRQASMSNGWMWFLFTWFEIVMNNWRLDFVEIFQSRRHLHHYRPGLPLRYRLVLKNNKRMSGETTHSVRCMAHACSCFKSAWIKKENLFELTSQVFVENELLFIVPRIGGGAPMVPPLYC